eukprot:5585880-Prymnesium_polylepis.1
MAGKLSTRSRPCATTPLGVFTQPWRAFQRRSGRHGDVPTTTMTTTSSSSARRSAGRGAMPPPIARCTFPTAAGCYVHCLPTVCPARPLHRTRFAVKRA